MADWSNIETALAGLRQPGTSPSDLAAIAAAQPSLRAQVAAHPSAYPGLLDWLDTVGGPDVKAAVAARRAGQQQVRAPQPPVQPQPAAQAYQQPQVAQPQPVAQPQVAQPYQHQPRPAQPVYPAPWPAQAAQPQQAPQPAPQPYPTGPTYAATPTTTGAQQAVPPVPEQPSPAYPGFEPAAQPVAQQPYQDDLYFMRPAEPKKPTLVKKLVIGLVALLLVAAGVVAAIYFWPDNTKLTSEQFEKLATTTLPASRAGGVALEVASNATTGYPSCADEAALKEFALGYASHDSASESIRLFDTPKHADQYASTLYACWKTQGRTLVSVEDYKQSGVHVWEVKFVPEGDTAVDTIYWLTYHNVYLFTNYPSDWEPISDGAADFKTAVDNALK
jgi:hypothetical protein